MAAPRKRTSVVPPRGFSIGRKLDRQLAAPQVRTKLLLPRFAEMPKGKGAARRKALRKGKKRAQPAPQQKSQRVRRRRSGRKPEPMAHHTAANVAAPERPLSLATGSAVALRGCRQFPLTVPANTTRVVLFNPGGATFVGGYVDYAAVPAGFASGNFDLTSAMYTPLPDTFLPTRGTITLLDTTKTVDRGGTVRVLQFSQSLVIANPPTQGQLDTVIAFLRSHPKAKPVVVNHRHEWDLHFVDGVRGQQFRPLGTTFTNFIDELDDPQMSTFIAIFEPYPLDRIFEVGVYVTAYCRYPAVGPLASIAKPIQTIPHSTFMAHNTAMAALGSAAHRIGEAAMSGVATVAEQAAYAVGRGVVGYGVAAVRGARALPMIGA